MKTKLLVLFTIITTIGVAMIVLKDNFGEYNKQVNYGYKLLEEGKYEEAVLAFNKAINIDKKKDRAYTGLMDTYKKENGEDAAQEIYNVASRAMLSAADTKAIQQRYEEIRNEYIKETGQDILPPTPQPNKANLANNNQSTSDTDNVKDKSNTESTTTDLYQSAENQLKDEYGMISDTEFEYTLTDSESQIISSDDSGIIRIVYEDLDSNGTEEMIVTRVEDENLVIEIYTVNGTSINVVPIQCFAGDEKDSEEPGDGVNYKLFATDRFEKNANIFIKNYDGKKYLCVEYGDGLVINSGDEDFEQRTLDIYEFDGETLSIINGYTSEIDFLWDGDEEENTYIVSDEATNMYDEYDDESEFIKELKSILGDYDLSGLWSDRAYLTNYTDDRDKHYSKASDRCSGVEDILNITSYLKDENSGSDVILDIDTCN